MKSSLLFQIILVISLMAVTIPVHTSFISPATLGHPNVRSLAPPSPSTPNVGIWNDACFASNITVANPQCGIGGASLAVGSTVTVDVNVTNAPAFNGYEFSLFYDPTNLTLSKVNIGSGTVFNNPFVARNDTSTPGTIREAVVNLGSSFNGSSGVLVYFTFNINGLGVSPFVLAAGTSHPAEGTGATQTNWTRLVSAGVLIDVSTSNGYFQNIQDIPAKLGPVASFTFSPALPLRGQTLVFDASSSFDADNSSFGAIMRYVWDFGDGQLASTVSPVITHIPPSGTFFVGNFSVLLTVYDRDNNFTGMVTHLVSIRDTSPPPPPSDFQLLVFVPPTGNFLIAGTSISVQVGLLSNSSAFFTGIVSLTGQFSPSVINGPTFSFNPPEISLGFPRPVSSALTISTTTATPPGDYTFTIVGTSGTLKHTIMFGLTILPAPTLVLTPSSGPLGTLVTVHGSGFFAPQGQFFSP